jgi:hypothetical protein
LPKVKTPNVYPSDSKLAATGLRETQVLIALSAFAVMMLILCVISGHFRLGQGTARIRRRLAGTTPQPLRRADRDKRQPTPIVPVGFIVQEIVCEAGRTMAVVPTPAHTAAA